MEKCVEKKATLLDLTMLEVKIKDGIMGLVREGKNGK
jgi:hypothetical protein